MSKSTTRSLAASAIGLMALSGSLLTSGVGTASANTSTGNLSATIANANLGKLYCDNNSTGHGGIPTAGKGFGTSCTGEEWCADFAKWAWNEAGYTDTGDITNGAWTFARHGATHNSFHWVTDTSYTPQPGDAVVWQGTSHTLTSYTDPSKLVWADVQHVSMVVSVTSRTSINDTGGNQSNTVSHNGPFNPTVGQPWGQKVIGYISPGIGTPPVTAKVTSVGTWTGTAPANTTSPQPASGTITLTATEASASRVLYYLDNTNPTSGSTPISGADSGGGANPPHKLAFDASGLANGSTHTITAAAYDATNTGQIDSTKSFTITINNSSGTVAASRSNGTVLYSNGLAASFAIRSDGNLYNAWQTLPSRTFMTANLGTGNTGGLVGNPAAILNADGLASVFARTSSGTIAQVWQNATTRTMDNWVPSIGSGSPTFAGDPTVVIYPSGYFAVFAVDTNGHLWTSWQYDATKVFSAWADLGTGPTSGLTGTPAAAIGSDGLASVFIRTRSGAIAQVWQNATTRTMDQWAGSIGTSSPTFAGDPAIVYYAGGYYSVFAVDTNGNMEDSWQYDSTKVFSAWANLGNGGSGGLLGTPAATVDSSNNLAAVFVRTASGSIATLSQNASTRTMGFSSTSIGSGSPTFAGDPSAILYPSGYYAAFAVDNSGGEWTSWQYDSTRIFSAWNQVQ